MGLPQGMVVLRPGSLSAGGRFATQKSQNLSGDVARVGVECEENVSRRDILRNEFGQQVEINVEPLQSREQFDVDLGPFLRKSSRVASQTTCRRLNRSFRVIARENRQQAGTFASSIWSIRPFLRQDGWQTSPPNSDQESPDRRSEKSMSPSDEISAEAH
jgi:hypothetical protein